MQVRDRKRPTWRPVPELDKDGNFLGSYDEIDTEDYGTSMLFGCREKLCCLDHWRDIFKEITADVILYLSSGLCLFKDSFNMSIEDTINTPAYNIDEPGLFTERMQCVRLCFYDFSSKREEISDYHDYQFIDDNGDILRNKIREEAEWRINGMILSNVFTVTTNAERRKMFGKTGALDYLNMQAIAQKALGIIIPEVVDSVVEGVVSNIKEAHEYGQCFEDDGSTMGEGINLS